MDETVTIHTKDPEIEENENTRKDNKKLMTIQILMRVIMFPDQYKIVKKNKDELTEKDVETNVLLSAETGKNY